MDSIAGDNPLRSIFSALHVKDGHTFRQVGMPLVLNPWVVSLWVILVEHINEHLQAVLGLSKLSLTLSLPLFAFAQLLNRDLISVVNLLLHFGLMLNTLFSDQSVVVGPP